MPKTYSSKEELIKDAGDIKASVKNEDMKHTVFLYFIARYLIVTLEARYNKATTQSWKEIRDAFDHYARLLSLSDDSAVEGHIKKIEGHIQRAVLDTCKILCREVHDDYTRVFNSYHKSAIMLVDNGDFVRSLQLQAREAEEIFLCAKTQDAHLGDDTNNNVEVLNKFLDAFFAYEKVLLNMMAKKEAVNAIEKTLGYLQKIHVRKPSVVYSIFMENTVNEPTQKYPRYAVCAPTDLATISNRAMEQNRISRTV